MMRGLNLNMERTYRESFLKDNVFENKYKSGSSSQLFGVFCGLNKAKGIDIRNEDISCVAAS